jgi:hypothetical protein
MAVAAGLEPDGVVCGAAMTEDQCARYLWKDGGTAILEHIHLLNQRPLVDGGISRSG